MPSPNKIIQYTRTFIKWGWDWVFGWAKSTPVGAAVVGFGTYLWGIIDDLPGPNLFLLFLGGFILGYHAISFLKKDVGITDKKNWIDAFRKKLAFREQLGLIFLIIFVPLVLWGSDFIGGVNCQYTDMRIRKY